MDKPTFTDHAERLQKRIYSIEPGLWFWTLRDENGTTMWIDDGVAASTEEAEAAIIDALARHRNRQKTDSARANALWVDIDG